MKPWEVFKGNESLPAIHQQPKPMLAYVCNFNFQNALSMHLESFLRSF